MLLTFTHQIAAPLSVVEEVLLDPTRVARAPASQRTVSAGELVRYERDGDAHRRVARFVVAAAYVPAGWLPVVGRLAWTEEVRWDHATRSGRFCIEPELPVALRRRVACDGTYRLAAADEGAATTRAVEVSLAVRVPLVGRVVEARLEALLAAHFEDEARGLERDAIARDRQRSAP